MEELVTLRTIGIKVAKEMIAEVARVATGMKVSGYTVVYSLTGMQEGSMAVGPGAKPLNVRIAMAKVETVFNLRQSTGVKARYIEKENIYPENYAEAIKTLFGGGLAIFADKDLKEFVGAIAFSGGKQEEDIVICQAAIQKVGLFTDEPILLRLLP
jgi:uncharacterized protein GlcG (DUF336 family)